MSVGNWVAAGAVHGGIEMTQQVLVPQNSKQLQQQQQWRQQATTMTAQKGRRQAREPNSKAQQVVALQPTQTHEQIRAQHSLYACVYVYVSGW